MHFIVAELTVQRMGVANLIVPTEEWTVSGPFTEEAAAATAHRMLLRDGVLSVTVCHENRLEEIAQRDGDPAQKAAKLILKRLAQNHSY